MPPLNALRHRLDFPISYFYYMCLFNRSPSLDRSARKLIIKVTLKSIKGFIFWKQRLLSQWVWLSQGFLEHFRNLIYLYYIILLYISWLSLSTFYNRYRKQRLLSQWVWLSQGFLEHFRNLIYLYYIILLYISWLSLSTFYNRYRKQRLLSQWVWLSQGFLEHFRNLIYLYYIILLYIMTVVIYLLQPI